MKAKLIAGVVSVIALACANTASAQILPVGTWPLNEGTGTVAHDTSMHHDDGTLTSGVTWGSGRFAGAGVFDGALGGVSIPDEAALEPASVSVSAWVNSSNPGPFKYIVAKGASNCSAASYGLYTGPNGGIAFYVSSNYGLSFVASPDGGTSLWNGAWHNVIGTFDGSTVRLYVDGVQVGSGTPDTTPIAYGLPTSNDLELGNYMGCYGLGFPGSIDQVRVFDRALSAQEIRIGVGASRALPTWFPFDLVL